ncbi:GNAT family N-acetyltransferase [Clostridium sp. D2Q-14]|uniref:GNAT family N-acetyltransferase n=1 Tax=Anaeromonas gelatinilytica TaxID=2683194 RepID=UPI00193B0DD8|nr:GNAT family N-acetyltransferase [Anaeromonas gelatinilytica]MBS4536507.1 GNAT family N-acetyltransferase [Anaeromonas gelatinilytica]
MPMGKFYQPEIININTELRLREFDNKYTFALDWYQDEATVKLVDGLDGNRYDLDKLKRMYEYLNNIGELYFIEILENDEFIPIGDVTFWKEDMPIVIGDKRYRGKGIGKKVIEALIERAKELDYKEIKVREIYTYNVASQKLFESIGFEKSENTANSFSYRLII